MHNLVLMKYYLYLWETICFEIDILFCISKWLSLSQLTNPSSKVWVWGWMGTLRHLGSRLITRIINAKTDSTAGLWKEFRLTWPSSGSLIGFRVQAGLCVPWLINSSHTLGFLDNRRMCDLEDRERRAPFYWCVCYKGYTTVVSDSLVFVGLSCVKGERDKCRWVWPKFWLEWYILRSLKLELFWVKYVLY